MRNIQKRFEKVRERNPYLGDYVVFYLAVKKQDFKEQAISRWFSVLIDKSEYKNKNRRELIKQLVEASRKHTEDDVLEADFASQGGQK